MRWVPPGWFGDQAAITRQVAQYYNGALKRVEIEIDVQWADFPGVWEHEVGHAMGLGYVSDKGSVMYPRLALTGPQRRTLSQHEAAHVRLMYDIPSGQRLAGGWGVWGRGDATLAGEDEFGARGVVGFDGFAADEPGAAGVILHGAAVIRTGRRVTAPMSPAPACSRRRKRPSAAPGNAAAAGARGAAVNTQPAQGFPLILVPPRLEEEGSIW